MKERRAIILPCGHEDELVPFGIPLWMKDQTREGAPAVCYTQYCRDCLKEALDDEEWVKDVFFDKHDADNWFEGAFSEWSGSKKDMELREADRYEQIAKEIRSKYE